MSQRQERVSVTSPAQPLTELFHLVRSLIPSGQRVVSAGRHTTVAEALEVMSHHGYSQLPVISGRSVLGVFSYRSLAQRLTQMSPVPTDLGSLPAEEFIEQIAYVQPAENWESILEDLGRRDVVLVGHRDGLDGILTAYDVLNFLHGIARPFVVLAEIEVSLRGVIGECVDDEALRACIHDSLSSKYPEGQLPTALEDLTFNDYAQIVCHGRNWQHFGPVFGEHQQQRKDAQRRLTEVRDLRNVVFHFRRTLTDDELSQLDEHRAWLEMKMRGHLGTREAEPARKAPATVPLDAVSVRGGPWTEARFFPELASRHGPKVADVAHEILAWCRSRGFYVSWGRGKNDGSFGPKFKHAGRRHKLFSVRTDGSVQVNFQVYASRSPFDQVERRRAVLEALNLIEGISLPDDAIDRYPDIRLVDLAPSDRLARFLEIMAFVAGQIRES